MKKVYFAPEVEVVSVEIESIMQSASDSLNTDGPTVGNGGDVRSKEYTFDLWEEE